MVNDDCHRRPAFRPSIRETCGHSGGLSEALLPISGPWHPDHGVCLEFCRPAGDQCTCSADHRRSKHLRRPIRNALGSGIRLHLHDAGCAHRPLGGYQQPAQYCRCFGCNLERDDGPVRRRAKFRPLVSGTLRGRGRRSRRLSTFPFHRVGYFPC